MMLMTIEKYSSPWLIIVDVMEFYVDERIPTPPLRTFQLSRRRSISAQHEAFNAHANTQNQRIRIS